MGKGVRAVHQCALSVTFFHYPPLSFLQGQIQTIDSSAAASRRPGGPSLPATAAGSVPGAPGTTAGTASEGGEGGQSQALGTTGEQDDAQYEAFVTSERPQARRSV